VDHALPGREPWELPTTSRKALEGAGFDIVEAEQPSFLFEGSVLVTGEVARTTDMAFAARLPEAFIQNTVGTTFDLVAAA
jgi:hypothetical protein